MARGLGTQPGGCGWGLTPTMGRGPRVQGLPDVSSLNFSLTFITMKEGTFFFLVEIKT